MKNIGSRKEIFLSQFDFKYREKIEQHCSLLNNINEDIVLFLARKAACFYRSLENLDLVQIRGKTIITDRALAMDCSWMKGKSVAVIDEIVISGTTMYDAVERVKAAGGVPKCYTLFINKERYNENALILNSDAIWVSELDARAVSSSMVDALSVLPRPYSVDYPLFKLTPMLKRDVNQLWSTVGWHSTNNTNEIQSRSNVYILTLTPSERILNRFKKEIGLNISGDLFKIRIYGQASAKGRNKIRVLPIVALDPLYRKDINELFECIINNCAESRKAITSFNSIKSRLRLIHFYIAHRFAQYWKSHVNKGLSKHLTLNDDVRELLLLFPPDIVDTVRNIVNQTGNIFDRVKVEQPTGEVVSTPESSLKAETMAEMQYNLIKPFSGVYREKEESQQEIYKNYGNRIHDLLDFSEESKRLKVGYTIPQLKSLIKGTCKSVKPSSLLSHFFDINIDSGIVVPITTKKSNKKNRDLDVLYRAYRYGEEAHKGERNIKLANIMLNELQSHLKGGDFQNINTEKFLVLFLIMGQRFLEPPINDSQVISVKYDQFGAVVNTGNNGFIVRTEDDSFANILKDVKVLESTDALDNGILKKSYKLSDNTIFSADQLKKEKKWRDAKQVGRLLGAVFGENSDAASDIWKNDVDSKKVRDSILKNKTDSLTLLASCSDLRRTALALSAEVGIFIKSWQRHSFTYKINDFKDIKDLENIRNKKTFRSLNSAQWKFREHILGKPYDLKKNIRNCLKEDSQYIWDTMWEDSEVIPDRRKDSRINNTALKAGEWCLNVFALYRLWEFWSFYVNSPQDLRKECISNIDKSRAYFNITKSNFLYPQEWTQSSYKSLSNKHTDSYIKNKRKLIIDLIDGMLVSGEKIIREAQGFIANSGKYQNICTYPYSLTVRFLDVTDDLDSDEIVERISNEIKERMKHDSIPKNLRHIFDRLGLNKSDNQFCVYKQNNSEWIIHDAGPGGAFWLAYSASLFAGSSDKVHCTLSLGTPNEIAPFSGLGSTNLTEDFYLDYLKDVTQDLHCYNVTILAKNENLLKLGKDVITTEFKGNITSHFKDIIKKTPNGKPLDSLYREGLALPSNSFIKDSHNAKKIGLLVIIENELSASINFLSENYGLTSERCEKFLEYKYRSTLPSSDEIGHSLILKSCLNKGNRSVINAANRFVEEDNPDLLVILGVGGSIHQDHNIGDVLFVSQVNYCEEGKDTPDGQQFRVNPWMVNSQLKSQMNHFFAMNGGETIKFMREGIQFKVTSGIIGSSEKVITNQDSEVRKMLLGIHDKTYQVDMESGGGGSFEYENSLRLNNKLKGLLIVRGASDKADVAKDKSAQDRATKNALYSLVKFLELVESDLSFLG